MAWKSLIEEGMEKYRTTWMAKEEVLGDIQYRKEPAKKPRKEEVSVSNDT